MKYIFQWVFYHEPFACQIVLHGLRARAGFWSWSRTDFIEDLIRNLIMKSVPDFVKEVALRALKKSLLVSLDLVVKNISRALQEREVIFCPHIIYETWPPSLWEFNWMTFKTMRQFYKALAQGEFYYAYFLDFFFRKFNYYDNRNW